MNDERPLVVVVSGTSGAGKSSLVAGLAGALRTSGVQVATLHFDDYTDVPDLPDGDLAGWLARGAVAAEWRTPAMVDALEALLEGQGEPGPRPRAVLVEEPFGRARPPFDRAADLSLHLGLPPQLALARRLLRELGPDEGALDPPAAARLRHHLRRFLSEGNALYEAVEPQALAGADVVLDAGEGKEQVTRLALRTVRRRLGLPPS